MKTFDAGLIAKLLSETASFYLLVAMDLVASAHRITDMDIPYYYDGNAYTPADLTLGQMSSGAVMQVETLDFTVQNVDMQMASHFLNDDQRGRQAVVHFTCLDDNRVAIATPQLFRGLIADWRMDELAIRITLKNELVLWKKRTLRKARVMCRWPFKGTECGYSGAAGACDKTYARCAVLGNTANYGGFRWIGDMMEKEIQWGPK